MEIAGRLLNYLKGQIRLLKEERQLVVKNHATTLDKGSFWKKSREKNQPGDTIVQGIAYAAAICMDIFYNRQSKKLENRILEIDKKIMLAEAAIIPTRSYDFLPARNFLLGQLAEENQSIYKVFGCENIHASEFSSRNSFQNDYQPFKSYSNCLLEEIDGHYRQQELLGDETTKKLISLMPS